MLAEARIRKGLTQTQVADALGVSRVAVSNWERGEARPDGRERTELLADLLGLNYTALQQAVDAAAPEPTQYATKPRVQRVREQPGAPIVVIPSRAYAKIEAHTQALTAANVPAHTVRFAEQLMSGAATGMDPTLRRRRTETEWLDLIERAWQYLRTALRQAGHKL